MSIAPTPSITMDQLLSSENRGRYELVHGQLEEVSVGSYSSLVGIRIAGILFNFCEKHDIGLLFDSGMYYRCFGEDGMNARKPDVSFIRAERLPKDWPTLGFFSIPPDLAVEVLSLNDTAFEMHHKVQEYLDGGVRLVWFVDPANRVVMIHRADGSTQKLHENDPLSGEGVLPGFSCVVKEFLLVK